VCKERGILFSQPMVAVLLEGRKTQTRRTQGLEEINKESDRWVIHRQSLPDLPVIFWNETLAIYTGVTPRYPVGTRLYTKETHYKYGYWDSFLDDGCWTFHASLPDILYLPPPTVLTGRTGEIGWYKRSSLFMFKADARIWQTVLDVKAQRVQEITEEDAIAEGITIMAGTHQDIVRDETTGKLKLTGKPEPYTARYHYSALWDSINGTGSWERNPWCWAYTLSKPEIRR